MDKADKELTVNVLTTISLTLMIVLLIVSFITWSINWLGIRGFLLGAVLYLIAQTLKVKGE